MFVVCAAIAVEPVINVEKAKILMAYRALLLGPPQPCTSDPCMVTISANVIASGAQTFCYVQFPASLTFANTSSGNPIKTITWSINTNGYLVEFHEHHGILVVDAGKKGQIIPDDSRTDELTYSAINKHRKKDVATYVPVVLYRANPTDVPSLCATGDPQIVNN
jgi:hypothetical protein